MLKQYLDGTKIEVGIDEAGRGCLFGPVTVAAVIWPQEDPDPTLEIKDSKKVGEKKRLILKDYIENNAIAWSVQFISHEEIDKLNILQATMKGMHKCIDEIREQLEIDTILVDGNSFKMYTDENLDCMDHVCVVNGDNTYKSIAAASILAKTHRDNYILELSKDNPELEKYGIPKNKGYGTKVHMDALKEYGSTNGHRMSFKPCQC
jgi:ribonuclease HII